MLSVVCAPRAGRMRCASARTLVYAGAALRMRLQLPAAPEPRAGYARLRQCMRRKQLPSWNSHRRHAILAGMPTDNNGDATRHRVRTPLVMHRARQPHERAAHPSPPTLTPTTRAHTHARQHTAWLQHRWRRVHIVTCSRTTVHTSAVRVSRQRADGTRKLAGSTKRDGGGARQPPRA